MHMRVMVGLAGLLVMGAAPVLAAQSRQPFSLQGSGEYVITTKDYGTTLQSGAHFGWEVQGRYTAGRVSLGAGYQRSTVFKSSTADLTGTISVGFVEPRYVIGVLGGWAAPYLAARVGYGKLLIRETPRVTENSFIYGAGAGVLIALAPHLALDLAGQYFRADFGGSGGSAGYTLARVGLAVGLF